MPIFWTEGSPRLCTCTLTAVNDSEDHTRAHRNAKIRCHLVTEPERILSSGSLAHTLEDLWRKFFIDATEVLLFVLLKVVLWPPHEAEAVCVQLPGFQSPRKVGAGVNYGGEPLDEALLSSDVTKWLYLLVKRVVISQHHAVQRDTD